MSRPQRPEEIQEQQGNANDTDSSFLQVFRDAGQTISGLARPENTLHSVAIAAVLILLSLCLTGQNRIFGRLAQGRTGQTDPMLFAKGQCLAVLVDLVRPNAFRVASTALPIPGHCSPEVFGFIERLEIQPFDSGVTVHQTDVQFWAKLGVGVGVPRTMDRIQGLGRLTMRR